jgi:hypothetical protein
MTFYVVCNAHKDSDVTETLVPSATVTPERRRLLLRRRPIRLNQQSRRFQAIHPILNEGMRTCQPTKTKITTQLITHARPFWIRGPAREVIAADWRPLVDELHVSKLGSLHGLVRGSGAEPRPRILLSAHMDAIGLWSPY